MDAVSDMSGSASFAAPFRGKCHLVLTNDDINLTTDLYLNALGMPPVNAMKVPKGVGKRENRCNPPYECTRHYFIDMGNDSLWVFSEIPKDEKTQTDQDALAGN